MGKELKYTEQNLFDIGCLRQDLYSEIEECRIKKRILDAEIERLTEIVSALDRHIDSIKKANVKED